MTWLVALPQVSIQSPTWDVVCVVTCRIAVKVPSFVAATVSFCWVAGRWPAPTNICARVSGSLTGRPATRAPAAARTGCGLMNPFRPNRLHRARRAQQRHQAGIGETSWIQFALLFSPNRLDGGERARCPSLAGEQHHPETGLTLHHLAVRLGGGFQRHGLYLCTDVLQHAEGEGVFRI